MNGKRKGYVSTSVPTTMKASYRAVPLDDKHLNLTAIVKKYGYRPIKGLPLPEQRKK